MKPIEYYKDREQTYLKHFFLERYLETVAYHIGFSQSEFVYVDCFSGPWRAKDEELGDTSIRIALNRLNSVRSGLSLRGKHPTIRAIFVEKSKTAFTTLQQVLQEHSGEIKTTALQGTFEENIGRILEQAGPKFTFFFVDPTGWTGFAMDNLRPILRRAKGEVMINFMYDPINRFLNFQSAANEKSLDRCFGTRDWRLVRDKPDRESTLVDLYVEQVRATGGSTMQPLCASSSPFRTAPIFTWSTPQGTLKELRSFGMSKRRSSPSKKRFARTRSVSAANTEAGRPKWTLGRALCPQDFRMSVSNSFGRRMSG